MKSIRSRFAMLVVTASITPLVLYGIISIASLRRATSESVRAGNLHLAAQAANQISLYLSNNIKVLRAAGDNLEDTRLTAWQRERVLVNYVLDFPELQSLTAFDPRGHILASSRISSPVLPSPVDTPVDGDGIHISEIEIDDDLLPRTRLTIQLGSRERPQGWLVAELSLEEMWRFVGGIRVGERGFALVVDKEGRLIAHGDPDAKERVARGENLSTHPLVRLLLDEPFDMPVPLEYRLSSDQQALGVAARIASGGWTLVLEQPTQEAYALTGRLVTQLLVAILFALLATVVVSTFWGRSFLRPIDALMRGTRAVSEGRLDTRVTIESTDELGRLGDAFNRMADRLATLQAAALRQERQAMFGRIAAGLAHDLAHPIQNIGNNCKLMLKMFDDPEYRATFKRMVDREFNVIRRVLDDLRNLARPIPLERFAIDVNRSIRDTAESLAAQAASAGVALELELSDEPLFVEGDLFALGRVYRNLILNAIQATPPSGTITLRTARAGEQLLIEIADTGCGIPPERLEAIFDDFVTTKRRGLGLGLAISKKLVEQMDGAIRAWSEVGKGTTFVLEFPLTQPAARAAAVG